MRRRLILMRHAKSSWKSDAPSDHTRPLNKRGRRAAPAMGRHLEELGWVPDLIVSSDAVRTKETCSLMTEAMEATPEQRYERSLYHAGITEIGAVLRTVDPTIPTVLLLGHNPGWSVAATDLTDVSVDLKTADAALLEIEAEDWASAFDADAGFELITIVRARSLSAPGKPPEDRIVD